MTTPTIYPLYFRYKRIVEGQTFLASVRILGRGLIEESEDRTWFCGINPSCMANDGEDYASAYLAYRNRLDSLLNEMAAESEDCEAFTSKVESLVLENSAVGEKDWDTARERVRQDEALQAALPIDHITETRRPEVFVTFLADIQENNPADDSPENENETPVIPRPPQFGRANTALAYAA